VALGAALQELGQTIRGRSDIGSTEMWDHVHDLIKTGLSQLELALLWQIYWGLSLSK